MYKSFLNSRLIPSCPDFSMPCCEQIAVFDRHNHEIRIAGGAVRDLLSGQTPHDIDLVRCWWHYKNDCQTITVSL